MNIIKILFYQTKSGKAPFIEWHEELDTKARAIVQTRLDRLELGNFGDSKAIKNGNGIQELRIAYGPGYRIYFGMRGTTAVILLVGGDKGNQERDITKAKKYWLDCKG